ncbi:hypothetical protein PC129_g1149 [Phytophthora cactorum]|uniref:Uncharacterized protein n=2 Tax=Phytophthora cactorum TaxID=29920 RepID=A0A8T1IUZ8_9STRA|nr:hypothetical protein PC114_g2479 [Phytophthora cactorum]KAG3228359.1 hypothetical protein PC129_g1149 [Phytophthora cactorum]
MASIAAWIQIEELQAVAGYRPALVIFNVSDNGGPFNKSTATTKLPVLLRYCDHGVKFCGYEPKQRSEGSRDLHSREKVEASAPVPVEADVQATAPAQGGGHGITATRERGGRTSAPADRLDPMFELLGGLNERVDHMESSQHLVGGRVSTDEDMGDSVFGHVVRSELERNLRADSLEVAMGVGSNAARMRQASPPLTPWQGAPHAPPLPNTPQPVVGTQQQQQAEPTVAPQSLPGVQWVGEFCRQLAR